MLSEMGRAVARYVDSHGGLDAVSLTPMDSVIVTCSTQPRMPFRNIYKPALCVVAQGGKRIEFNDKVLNYSAGSALVVSVELPGFGSITQASEAVPFLGLIIQFDLALLREVISQIPQHAEPDVERFSAFIEILSAPAQDCITRLIRLFDTPEAVPALYPGIVRELYYWLLTGPNGDEISKIAHAESHSRRIADAIHLMRNDISRPLSIDDMAEVALMSKASFHRHFKILTSLSPLQYYKQLRLIEARRLMVAEAASVTDVAFRVGYESSSQFSREYSRMFGAAPKKDVAVLKAMAIPL